jgi:hypothetical protein
LVILFYQIKTLEDVAQRYRRADGTVQWSRALTHLPGRTAAACRRQLRRLTEAKTEEDATSSTRQKKRRKSVSTELKKSRSFKKKKVPGDEGDIDDDTRTLQNATNTSSSDVDNNRESSGDEMDGDEDGSPTEELIQSEIERFLRSLGGAFQNTSLNELRLFLNRAIPALKANKLWKKWRNTIRRIVHRMITSIVSEQVRWLLSPDTLRSRRIMSNPFDVPARLWFIY